MNKKIERERESSQVRKGEDSEYNILFITKICIGSVKMKINYQRWTTTFHPPSPMLLVILILLLQVYMCTQNSTLTGNVKGIQELKIKWALEVLLSFQEWTESALFMFLSLFNDFAITKKHILVGKYLVSKGWWLLIKIC